MDAKTKETIQRTEMNLLSLRKQKKKQTKKRKQTDTMAARVKAQDVKILRMLVAEGIGNKEEHMARIKCLLSRPEQASIAIASGRTNIPTTAGCQESPQKRAAPRPGHASIAIASGSTNVLTNAGRQESPQKRATPRPGHASIAIASGSTNVPTNAGQQKSPQNRAKQKAEHMERLQTLLERMDKLRQFEKKSLASAAYTKEASLDLELIHHLQTKQCIGCERSTSDEIVTSFAIEFQNKYSTLNKDLKEDTAGLKFSTPKREKKRVPCNAAFVLHGINEHPERTKHADIHQEHSFTKTVYVLKITMKPGVLKELTMLNSKLFPDQKNKLPKGSDNTYFIVYPESGAVCKKLFSLKNPENEQKQHLRMHFAANFDISETPLKAKLTTHLLLGSFRGKKQYQSVGNERCCVCELSGPRKSTSTVVIYDHDHVREVSGEDGLRLLSDHEEIKKYTTDSNGKKKGAVLKTATEQREGLPPVRSKTLRTFGSNSGPLKLLQIELRPDDRLSKNEEAARFHCEGFIEYSEKENSQHQFHFRIIKQPEDSLHHVRFAQALQQARESSYWKSDGKVCFNSVNVTTNCFMTWFGESSKQGLWTLCNELRCSGEWRARAQSYKRKRTSRESGSSQASVSEREREAYHTFIQNHGPDFTHRLWGDWGHEYGDPLPYSKRYAGQETRSGETVVLVTDNKPWNVCELNFVLDHFHLVQGSISDRNPCIHKIAHILGRQMRAVERKFNEIKEILNPPTTGNISKRLKELVHGRHIRGWGQRSYKDSPVFLSDSGNKKRNTASSSASKLASAVAASDGVNED
jgi:hypothetical protein